VRRLRYGAAAGALLAVLAGCASVPTNGPVQQGDPVGVAAAGGEFVRVIAQPPQDGVTPADLVQGFLVASSSSDYDYATARQYLTPTAAAGWNPHAGVQIADVGGLQISGLGSLILAKGSLDGTIAADNSYTVAPAGATIDASYQVVKVGGQWRIAELPTGLILKRDDVVRGFRTYDLFFLDPSRQVLVPDPITVPVTGAGDAVALTRALLGGPTTWLRPAVTTAFPAGTALATDSVPIDNGVAQVNLTSQVLAADDQTRQMLCAQLIHTLLGLPDVSGVTITVGDQPLAVSGAGLIQTANQWSRFDPTILGSGDLPLASVAGQVVQLTPATKPIPVAGLVGKGKLLLFTPVESLDGTTLAGVTPNRSAIWTQSMTGTPVPVRVITGGKLTRPSWDRTNALWTVSQGHGVVRYALGKQIAVPVDGLPTGTTVADITRISVARDGARAAVLLRQGAQIEPWLALIVRTSEGVRLAGLQRIENTIVDASDIAWQGANTLAILGVADGAPAQVFTVSPGFGDTTAQLAPTGADHLAAAPGAPLLVSSNDVVYRALNGTFAKMANATGPSYPG
jgi:hypothetical protein